MKKNATKKPDPSNPHRAGVAKTRRDAATLAATVDGRKSSAPLYVMLEADEKRRYEQLAADLGITMRDLVRMALNRVLAERNVAAHSHALSVMEAARERLRLNISDDDDVASANLSRAVGASAGAGTAVGEARMPSWGSAPSKQPQPDERDPQALLASGTGAITAASPMEAILSKRLIEYGQRIAALEQAQIEVMDELETLHAAVFSVDKRTTPSSERF